MAKKNNTTIRQTVQDAVKKISRSASTGSYSSTKTYETRTYGDLTVLTSPATPSRKK